MKTAEWPPHMYSLTLTVYFDNKISASEKKGNQGSKLTAASSKFAT